MLEGKGDLRATGTCRDFRCRRKLKYRAVLIKAGVVLWTVVSADERNTKWERERAHLVIASVATALGHRLSILTLGGGQIPTAQNINEEPVCNGLSAG